jgi:hypothetical protein
MKCQEKEALQTECAAAWESYAVEVAKAGLSVTGSGSVRPPSISELVSGRLAIDLRAGRFPAAYSTAIRLRGKHLAASLELSKHLSRHRC